jgi:two-component system, LytTR family, response regulator
LYGAYYSSHSRVNAIAYLLEMKYNLVIVEDEKHQQESMLRMLEEIAAPFRVCGVAANIDEAYRLIQQWEPHLVFLDVMLPPDTSFDLLRRFDVIDFKIIFTTSFEEFAVRAFRLSAVDYLVKPLSKDELRQAVDKFLDLEKNTGQSENLNVLMTNLGMKAARLKKIALPTLNGFTFVTIDDIVRCESDNTYTTFFLRDKRKILISKTLKECETLLSEFSFFRVHQSNMINMDHIVEYERGDGGVVKMADGSSVDVSRRRKDEFVRQFLKVGMERYQR